MGTVLEKPVLLDETGQNIVDKLDEIKTAIGSTGEFIPVMIKVTTPPTKTIYGVGEALDLSGIVIELFGSNGARFDVTEQCTFSPANGTVLNQNTSVEISYEWYKDQSIFTTYQNVRIKSLASIAVSTPPIITEYNAGDTLDLAGMVVTATFDDNSTIDATSQCVFSPADGAILSITDSTIEISLTISGITKTTTQQIEVYGIFGVTWDGTASSAFTRTDAAANFSEPIPAMSDGNGGYTQGSSPFDGIMPWSGMVVEEDETNQITLVKIPKYYYKLEKTGAAMSLKISATPREGFLTSPAHSDRGDGEGERDFIFVGAYTSNSKRGAAPIAYSFTRTTLNTAHDFGNDYWVWDYATKMTILFLYLVEFADWNSQDKIGKGAKNGTLSANGITDAIPYHTGTTETAKSIEGYVKYRNIENLWSNMREWITGFVCQVDSSYNPDLYITKNPSLQQNLQSSNNTYADFSSWTRVGRLGSAYSGGGEGIIKSWTVPPVQGFDFAIYPNDISGTNTSEYVCDNGGTIRGQQAGTYTQHCIMSEGVSGFYAGIAGMKITQHGGSNINQTIRLMRLPANT